VEKIIGWTSEQCVCAQCRDNTELIGYETSEQLDVEPAKFRKLKSFNFGL
jgi:transposase